MAPLQLAGGLAGREHEPIGDHCPMDRTIQVIGSRPALLLLREAFYGARRFDDLARGVGITDAVAAQRLKELVAVGVLEKVPYREPGQRTRHEYVLTEAGHELLPVVLGLLAWGDRHLPTSPSTVRLSHDGCGAAVAPALRCAAGHDVPEEEVVVRSSRRRGVSERGAARCRAPGPATGR